MPLLKPLLVLFLFSFAAADPSIVIDGEISDTQCAFDVHSTDGSHTAMTKTNVMGRTAEECTRTCVRNGGQYVLVDAVNKKVYRLAEQGRAAKFAAKQVRVRGIYDTNKVFSITSIEVR